MIRIKSVLFLLSASCLVGLLLTTVLPAQAPPAASDDPTRHDSGGTGLGQSSLSGPGQSGPLDTTAPSGNPFRARIPYGDGGFVPASHVSIPAGIQVLAIMVVQGQEPLAVLDVPGMMDAFYVRAGDIIGVESRAITNRSRTATQGQGLRTAESEIVYLKIEDVTAQQVELYPQQNPAGRQILR
jgi:hypothetical protein